MSKPINNPPVLCYIDRPWAYFTTQELSKQWGDDWNDAPYEHNAGEPYGFHSHDKAEGKPPWEIVKVAFEGPFDTPADLNFNSRYSVEKINQKHVAWLSGDGLVIHAGVPLEEFCDMIIAAGGEVYCAARQPQAPGSDDT